MIMRILVFFSCLIISGHAWAKATSRFAIIAGNSKGIGDEIPLKYTISDMKKIRDTLREVGDIDDNNIIFVPNAQIEQIKIAFEEIVREISNRTLEQDESTMFLFYYSGHADEQGLHLKNSFLEHSRLVRLIDEVPAVVKIGILDSCNSGAIVNFKGAKKVPMLPQKIDSELSMRGTIMLTSSGQTEYSQESEELKGSFFTHHFVSALRGAADLDNDKLVSLDEAYRYSYQKTILSTLQASSGVQHPTITNRVVGGGEIILSNFAQHVGILQLPEELAGSFFITDNQESQIFAEVNKSAGELRKVALYPGEYLVKWKEKKRIKKQPIEIEENIETSLSKDDIISGDTVSYLTKSARYWYKKRLHAGNGIGLFSGIGKVPTSHSAYSPFFGAQYGINIGSFKFENQVSLAKTSYENDLSKTMNLQMINYRLLTLYPLLMKTFQIHMGMFIGGIFLEQEGDFLTKEILISFKSETRKAYGFEFGPCISNTIIITDTFALHTNVYLSQSYLPSGHGLQGHLQWGLLLGISGNFFD